MITINKLEKSFQGHHVLRGVSLHLEKGTIYGLLGQNGVGKSTLLRIIAGLMSPDKGSISVSGEDLFSCSGKKMRERIGYVPDNPYLYSYLTGFEYLGFIYELWGLDSNCKNEEIHHYLQLLGLENKKDHLIGTYSQGMCQKLSVAQALLPRPSIIILDEPLTGFDPVSIEWAKELFKDLAKEGKVILLTTHMLEVAHFLCNKIGILVNGKITTEIDNQLPLLDFSKRARIQMGSNNKCVL